MKKIKWAFSLLLVWAMSVQAHPVAYTPEQSVDISLPEQFYFPGATTEATVTAGGPAGENGTIAVTISGPGSISPGGLNLVPGEPQTVQITLPSQVEWATYTAKIDDSNPEIKDDERVGTVNVEMTSQYDTVAAGAIGTDIHQSEITIKVTDPDGNGVPDMCIPQPEIASGGLGPEDNEITADAGFDEAPATDSSGVVTGKFTSGHRVQSTTVSGPAGKSVTIAQAWNDLEGSDDAWDFPRDFYYEQADTITYKMRLDRGNGPELIDGHSFRWITTGIGGIEWKEGVGEDWTGPDGEPDGSPDGEYDDVTYTDEDDDLEGFLTWQGLSEFTGAGSTGGNYIAQQIIHFNWDFIADKVWFDVVDLSVFDAEGAE